jgi:hypothetical protein
MKAVGSRAMSVDVQVSCMRALGNVAHALGMSPREHPDYQDPSLVGSLYGPT